MNKLLFISNDSKPSEEKYNYIGEEKLTNFSIPIVKACETIGLEVTIGINRRFADKMTCRYPVHFFNAQIYRNPFNIKEVMRAYRNVCNELNKGEYIGIHCNTPIGGVVGRLAGKKCGIQKVIYTAHGFHFYKGAPIINWLLYYPIEQWLAHYTDVLITINQEDYERAKKFHLRNHGKVYYVPGVGIDTKCQIITEETRLKKREEIGVPKDALLLISVGDLNKNKNNRIIIEALKRIDDNIHYILCGEGPLLTELTEAARPIKDRVHFLGYRTDIKELLAASDIFVMPSFREGLSRSLMEAMVAGLPCIVSRIRGNTDLIERKELLCSPDRVDEFVDAIRSLDESKDIRSEIGEENNKRVQKYSETVVIEKITQIYKEEFRVSTDVKKEASE